MLDKKKLQKIARKELREDNMHFLAEEIANKIEHEIKEDTLTKSDVPKVLKEIREHFSGKKKIKTKPVVKVTRKDAVVKKVDTEATDKILTPDEIEKIVTAAKKTGIKEEVITKLFFKLGLTLVEIANLQVEQIDKLKKLLHLETRDVHIDAELLEELLQLSRQKRTGKIFITSDGHFSKTDVLNMIRMLMEAAGVRKRKDIETATQQYFKRLRQQGKAFMYWEQQDEVIKLRNDQIKKRSTN